jgi:1-deoxy-D-xylulose-5-phosphate synthase
LQKSDQAAAGTPLFDSIKSPADLKKLDPAQLPQLAQELRQAILDTVQVTGGHLGSGMGVVELTIALHYIFDFSHDRLIFDVGHQAYPHKLLTERKDRMLTLRQKGGLSGFTNRWESKYDVYNMGHAGTAASAALGIAAGDRIAGRDRHAVALVGDAAMGAGVAFEGLNYAGSDDKLRALVILNDNSWSIAKTVGALSRYLDRVRTGPFYSQAKKNLHSVFKSIPLIGKELDEKFDHAIDQVRKLVVPGQVFEELGLSYYGPIDGHNMPEVLDYLTRVKDLEGVTLLHVRTQKGKGVHGSEDRYDRAHAAKPGPKPTPKAEEKKADKPAEDSRQAASRVPAAAKATVVPAREEPPSKAKAKAWTSWFGDGLEELAAKDERVFALTAAMPDGTGLMGYAEKYPERYMDAGIAEQHAVAFASGLATAGLRPVAAIYSTFLQRAYDQVFQEVALQHLPVVFAMDRAGLVGEDGPSHHGVFDIAYLRAFPGMTLMAPKDGPELEAMLAFALTLNGPSGIRYPRGSAPIGRLGNPDETAPLEIGKMEVLRQGGDGAILAYGHMVNEAMEAAKLLEARGVEIEVVNARFVKPLDESGILGLAGRHDRIITLEDHSVCGGFGSAVLELCAANGPQRAQIEVLGIPDRFIEHGSKALLMKDIGLDAASIAERFLSDLTAPV